MGKESGKNEYMYMDCKDAQPIHAKGDQSWVFTGKTDVEAETPVLWPPDVNSWLIWKDPDAGKDWGKEERGKAEDEMVGWHHQWTWIGEKCERAKDREAWRAAVHGVAKGRMWLNNNNPGKLNFTIL